MAVVCLHWSGAFLQWDWGGGGQSARHYHSLVCVGVETRVASQAGITGTGIMILISGNNLLEEVTFLDLGILRKIVKTPHNLTFHVGTAAAASAAGTPTSETSATSATPATLAAKLATNATPATKLATKATPTTPATLS